MKTINLYRLLTVFCICLVFNTSYAQKKKIKEELTSKEIANIQGHGDAYADKDPRTFIKDVKVLKNLEEWQDLKFGFMVHWGIYSQWSSTESWPLNDDPLLDKDWGRSKLKAWGESGKDIKVFRKMYWDLNKTFNPVQFDASRWADLAEKAGMKYFVFTTMHHDGFNMFDSKFTNYKITSKEVPFHTNPNADVTKALFNAFRDKGFKIGAYYSKPTWHHNDFWTKEYPINSRNTNYNVLEEPERWERYVKFTHNNIDQLLSDYGKVDILWLDGGWVNPNNRNQDIRMSDIAEKGRKKQPGLIVVDRTVHGENENYITPEQRIPENPILYPWETCMTMGAKWSYRENEIFKPTHQVINMLVDVVAKGGNFLLNIGTSPEGWFHPIAVKQMEKIGEWMKVNGEAIYATKPVAPYRAGKFGFTQNKNGNINAIYLADEGEKLPQSIDITGFEAIGIKSVELLGYGVIDTFKIEGNKLIVNIPENARQNPPCDFAYTFVLKN